MAEVPKKNQQELNRTVAKLRKKSAEMLQEPIPQEILNLIAELERLTKTDQKQ